MIQGFFGGVHPDTKKSATSGKAIEQLSAAPDFVVLPMSMHVGAPCTPIVAVGDYVKIGQKIAEPNGLGAPIHASVSGTVTAIEPRPFSMGGKMLSVVIENDKKDAISEEVHASENPELLSPEEMIEIVKNAGIVGLGGATFPTYVKLSGKGIRTVIVNGAECEPYLTDDHRTMLEHPGEVIGGASCLARIFGVNKVVIGIETNKRNAIAALRKATLRHIAPVEIHPLPTRYPQGSEKQLCQAITGKQVPAGGLPSAIGCAVFNVNTVREIYRAIHTGMPLVRKTLTVSGDGVRIPKNIECPIGTPVSALLDFCGGVRMSTYKLIAGGPMMGMAQYTADVPVTKGMSAVIALSGAEKKEGSKTCIRCGRCVDACPMHLEPLFMNLYYQRGMTDELENAHVTDCIECGACSYICPGRLDLTQTFKAAKQQLKEQAARRKAAAEKEA